MRAAERREEEGARGARGGEAEEPGEDTSARDTLRRCLSLGTYSQTTHREKSIRGGSFLRRSRAFGVSRRPSENRSWRLVGSSLTPHT